MGVVSPIGNNLSDLWDSLVAGRSGVGPITRFDPSSLDTRFAAEVKDFDAEQYMDKKDVRRSDRFVRFAAGATSQALAQAGLSAEKVNPDRFGVIIGSGIGGIETWEGQYETLRSKGPSRVSPFFIPMMISDMASGQISMMFGAKGPNFCTVSACSSGAHAIGEAFRTIQRGEADVLITGGTEASITILSVAGFCAMKALSTRNDDPGRASRPFDAGRDGFVMGEGAGVLIVESLEHAQQRGAPILAELVGYGATADAYHMTAPAPEGEGAARAMAHCLASAGLRPEEVKYINAHGTSTPMNDKFETMAMRATFGDAVRSIPVSSTKSMMGHLLGASGGVELIVCILAMQRGMIPPTINYETPDPECDLDYVPNTPRPADIDIAMSNSFGFGGHNVSLAVKRWNGGQ
jgi:3-oxoacyl-[acyl-carrier-protein] synthase II